VKFSWLDVVYLLYCHRHVVWTQGDRTVHNPVVQQLFGVALSPLGFWLLECGGFKSLWWSFKKIIPIAFFFNLGMLLYSLVFRIVFTHNLEVIAYLSFSIHILFFF
jgi:hypothetical protein